MILKLYEDASSPEINFLKANSYELEHIKIDQPRQMEWSQFSINKLEVILATLSWINPIGTK